MARVTWIGDAEEGTAKETVQYGITFKKDEAVEVKDLSDHVMKKFLGNPYFKVEDYEPPPEQKAPNPFLANIPPNTTLVHTPPSRQTVPGAVPKPGEPLGDRPGVAGVQKEGRTDPIATALAQTGTKRT